MGLSPTSRSVTPGHPGQKLSSLVSQSPPAGQKRSAEDKYKLGAEGGWLRKASARGLTPLFNLLRLELITLASHHHFRVHL